MESSIWHLRVAQLLGSEQADRSQLSISSKYWEIMARKLCWRPLILLPSRHPCPQAKQSENNPLQSLWSMRSYQTGAQSYT